MVRRGTVYHLAGGSAGLFGVLVLTNDTWNRRMGTVGVVPVRQPTDPDTIWTPHFGIPPLQASVGFLASFRSASLLAIRLVLNSDDLAKIGQSLADLLHIVDLGDTPPIIPPQVAGSKVFPRWGEIYYAGPAVGPGNQTKRYVVVSDERWNVMHRAGIAVRTTTQPKSWGAAFPAIEGGAARACCGDATVFPVDQINLRHRPQPSSLSLDDMVAIGGGLRDVFDLDPT